MNVVCSPTGIVNPSLPGQGVTDIVNAGFENISLEFDMSCSAYELEQHGRMKKNKGDCEHLKESMSNDGFLRIPEYPDKMGNFFEKMISMAHKKQLQIPIARAPYLPRDTKRADLRDLMLRLHEESIRCCGSIGCEYIVIRPFPTGDISNAAVYIEAYTDTEKESSAHAEWEVNREYYLRLAAVAHENNVKILLENQCRSMNGHMVRGACSDSYEAAEWIDTLNRASGEERFGFCMDAGVCSLCGQDMHEFALALGNRIKAVVLRDCNGQQEGALLPFTCVQSGQPQTDWLNLIRGLREICFDGQMILSFADTAGVFSPLLRPQLMTLAKAVGEYFKWQVEIEKALKRYDSIVLFGAGNMCRNYMKCYGEQYPPLFTCDNNQNVWGTQFCGLEVKSPEALRELPEGCGVFICNIYYREIEQQLRDMGIKNIEFFNDEYMPSFYFDRLEMV